MNEPENSGSRRRFRLWWWIAATPGVWWIASILVHTAIFGVLTVVTPKRSEAPPASPDELTMTISPDRVEEVVEEIRDRVSEEFQEQVLELQDIQRELEEANITKVRQYNELMKSDAAVAPDAVKKATQEALAAQAEAIQAQEGAKATLSKLGKAHAEGAAKSPANEKAPAPSEADAGKDDLAATQNAISAAQGKANAAQAQIEQQLETTFANADHEVRRAHQANIELQAQASKMQVDARTASQALDRLRVKEADLQAKALTNGNKAGAEKVQGANDAKIAEVNSAIAAAVQQTHQLEEQAQGAQKKAKEALERSADQIAKAVAKASQPTPVAVPAPAKSAPAMTKNLAKLYEQAVQTENTLTNTYKHVRAAELASIRKLPMAQALALTQVAKPVRKGVDTKILSANIRDAQGVHTQEKAINAAGEELASMVALARRMRALALPDTSAGGVSVDDLQEQAEHSEKMEQLALQSEGEEAKDLTGEMGEGKGKEGKAGHGSGGEGKKAGRAGHGFDQGPETNLPGKQLGPPSYLFAAPREMRPIPGRTIGGDMQNTAPGRNGYWMFVDSWYIIGPWPNPGRKNLNTKFPPETVVDLNATYTGGKQDEKPMNVRWKFYQAPALDAPLHGTEMTGQIIPPGLGEYEIYYAYTEVRSDEARDVWVAIGSDDQSKIWINDDMIWKSSDQLKNWVPNEGLRKIHLRQGINRILYRYENGHSSGCFSFFISLRSTDTAPLPTNVLRGR